MMHGNSANTVGLLLLHLLLLVMVVMVAGVNAQAINCF
jgi:hypothetical protein